MMVMYYKRKVFVHLHNLKFHGVSYAAASVPTYSISLGPVNGDQIPELLTRNT